MSSFISAVIATIITAPLIGYILVFVVSKQITNNHQRAVFLAIDVTTLLLIISVHFIVQTIWHQSFFWLILIVVILIAMLFVFIHWKTKNEINLKRVMRGFWRFNFLLFSVVYLVLILLGIVSRVLTTIMPI